MNLKVDTVSLKEIQESVGLLHRCSQEIIKVMEEQIDAIIASNPNKIEQLSETHSSLSQQFKVYEQDFIVRLTALLGKKEDAKELRLLKLKELFPDWSDEIGDWHQKLEKNTKDLQRKHNQILQLLEFAMSQNARLMRSMYSSHNEKNLHYGATGKPASIPSGIAVNQEV